MPSQPRKPWRVLIIGPDVVAQSDHGTKAAAYALLRAALRGDSPANTAIVERWQDGSWRQYAKVSARSIR
ncbi:hypothetical protein ACFV0T_26630 [Streptomyces sp. NPDC059582]|uniref:hypothetical protein n=1 Tax=Streptomyces sp. NPDC059582 TaxID=3346875 RepID=UPI0036750CEF